MTSDHKILKITITVTTESSTGKVEEHTACLADSSKEGDITYQFTQTRTPPNFIRSIGGELVALEHYGFQTSTIHVTQEIKHRLAEKGAPDAEPKPAP